MNRSGYNTVFLGKYLNGYGVDDARVTGKNSFRYVPPGWTEWWGSVERPPGSGIATGGTYDYYHAILNHNGLVHDRYAGSYQTVVEGRIVRQMVLKYHRSPKPFFLYFAPIAPHFGGPREADDPTGVRWPGTGAAERFKTPARPARVRGTFDGTVTRPPGIPLSGTDGPREMQGLPRPVRTLPPIAAPEQTAMLAVTRQRGEALLVLDQQIGELVRTLKATGEYDDTVLMFTSDNGYFLGEHRIRQGKIWTHEPSLRVPFLVAGPKVPHGVRNDPISSPDVAATILALGGARSRRPLDGVSLVPSFAADRGWRRPVLLENRLGTRVLTSAVDAAPKGWPGAGITASGIRTARYAYVRYVDGDAELYDLDRDPNELRNVYDQPQYAAVQRELATVWEQRRSCRGAACSAPLPADLQAAPDQLRASTGRQQRGVQARYGEPVL
jgi:arylsulfatase A-like enzyme